MVEIEGRPWAEYRHGKAMTQNQLARALKPLGIVPELIRQGENVSRGYTLGQFAEAFERYLAPEGAFKPLHRYKCDECSTSDMFQTVTRETDVTVPDCEKPNNDGLCNGVTVAKGEVGENRAIRHGDDPETSGHNEPEFLTETAADTGPDDAATAEPEFGAVPKRTRAKVEPPLDDIPACLRRCIQCGAPSDTFGAVTEHDIGGKRLWLHQQCADFRRRRLPKLESIAEPRKDGPWAGSYLCDDDINDIESGRAFK